MKYKLHRVAPNSEGWKHPSPGRLGAASGVGAFVKANGFGHEDWNFNFSFAHKGRMRGYTVARPAAKVASEKFGVVLATYDKSGWKAVGYYEGAIFEAKADPLEPAVLCRIAVDIFELAECDSVGSKYKGKTLSKIEQTVSGELLFHRWIIPEDHVFAFKVPALIPSRIFSPKVQRMTISYNLSKQQFDAIKRLRTRKGYASHTNSRSAEEGRLTLKLHKSRERNGSLISEFKKGLTSFACEVCGFDFEKKYGSIGKGFIECHHIKPVSEMRAGEKTSLADLRAVCSNCHRMLHADSPLLTIEELRKKLVERSNRD